MNGKCINAIRKMYILFYVDDAVIPAGTPVDLQNSLNEFYSFFEQWNYFFHVQCLSKKKTKNIFVNRHRRPSEKYKPV